MKKLTIVTIFFCTVNYYLHAIEDCECCPFISHALAMIETVEQGFRRHEMGAILFNGETCSTCRVTVACLNERNRVQFVS